MHPEEFHGRLRKIFRMFKLLLDHVNYLPEPQKQKMKDLIIDRVRGKAMKAERGE